MTNRFWLEAAASFVGAGLWIGGFLWIRTSLRSSDPLYGWAHLLLMASAIPVPVAWVTARKRFSERTAR